MMKWTPQRIIALALGSWMAFAPALHAVPMASIMTMQMSMSDGAGSGECNGCPDAGMDRDGCAVFCTNAIPFAIVAGCNNLGSVGFRVIKWQGRYSPLIGRILVPD